MSENNTNQKEIVNVTVVDENEKLNPLDKYKNAQIDNPLDPKYEEPQRYGDYMRPEKGINSFRALSSAIVGCEYWTEVDENGVKKKKPVRRPSNEANSLDEIGIEWDYFQAFFIWNYKAQKVQIFSTVKRGIIDGIRQIIQNPKWGEPFHYDICVNKTQSNPADNLSVKYLVTPEPREVNENLEKEIKETWKRWGFDRETLFMLFESLDPFEEKRKQDKEKAEKEKAEKEKAEKTLQTQQVQA